VAHGVGTCESIHGWTNLFHAKPQSTQRSQSKERARPLRVFAPLRLCVSSSDFFARSGGSPPGLTAQERRQWSALENRRPRRARLRCSLLAARLLDSSTLRLFAFRLLTLDSRLPSWNRSDVDSRPTLGCPGGDEGFRLLRIAHQRENRLSRRRLDNG
jgi:hypothetical protein